MEIEKEEQQNISTMKKVLDVVLDSAHGRVGYFEQCREILHKIQKKLNVGKVEVRLSNMNNIAKPNLKNMAVILYQEDNYNEQDVWIKSTETESREVVEFRFYPKYKQIFLKYQLDTIAYLVKIFFIFFEKDRKEEYYQEQLKRDNMTGVYNQAGIFDFIMKLQHDTKIERYDAFFINIKRFKYINETLGFDIGNMVMTEYAHQLNESLMDYEAIGRVGGDNFVALVTRGNSNQFRDLCMNMDVEVHLRKVTKRVTLEAVCGIYQIEDQISNPGDIMTPLSIALKAAKELFHQDYLYYSKELNQQVMEMQRVISDYKSSLSKGEFVAYYQPKYSLTDNRLCGAEALVRWIHNGSVIPPCNFIPVLEKDGSVCSLDFEMLKQTCQLIAQWKSMGIQPIRISVNLSRWHLQNKNLVKDILRIIEDYDVDPKYIEFELTETVNYDEYAVMSKLFMELKAHGFATAIDDFGTGYSSLNLLKTLDVDVLKLDKTFISEINSYKEKKDRILIRNIIHMAKDLDMKVIAEGIENREQQEFLKEAECDMAQGFLYARPMPPEDFKNLLTRDN